MLAVSADGNAEQTRGCGRATLTEVLGAELDLPKQVLICSTRDGSLTGDSSRSGGTGHALRIAHANGISMTNLARPDHRARSDARGQVVALPRGAGSRPGPGARIA